MLSKQKHGRSPNSSPWQLCMNAAILAVAELESAQFSTADQSLLNTRVSSPPDYL
jgi:hypothetical protein